MFETPIDDLVCKDHPYRKYAFTGVAEKSTPLFSLSRNRVPPKNSEKKGDTAEHDSCCSPKYT